MQPEIRMHPDDSSSAYAGKHTDSREEGMSEASHGARKYFLNHTKYIAYINVRHPCDSDTDDFFVGTKK